MDRETLEYFDKHFKAIDKRFEAIDGRFEAIDRRFGELEDRIHAVHVVVEDLGSRIRAVAEGVAQVSERLDRFQEQVRAEFQDMRLMVRLSYSDLDRRLAAVEKRA